MSVSKIAIIGAGQIGRRHLQALTSIDRPVHIQVVDPSDDSLQKAKTAYSEAYAAAPQTKQTQKVEYLQDASRLPMHIDVVIVATSADVRKAIVENLLQHKQVRYLLLEKVVFQHPDHFSDIHRLLTQQKMKAWVNCPLRTVPFYQKLKKKLGISDQTNVSTESSAISYPVDYRVSGAHWNLGSNAIHHLDLFSFLTAETDFQLDASLLDQHLLPSKRAGFLELTGTLLGKSDKGNGFTLTSYSGGKAPLFIQISNPHLRCILSSEKGTRMRTYISEEAAQWQWSETTVHIPYQSQLTHLLVQQMLDHGQCDLPSYTTSWKLHLPLLDAISEHIQKQTNRRDDVCPIT